MKDKIYTIPVTEAFSEDCECPLCLLESRTEEHYLEYHLGPSLMEPDCRKETNDKGFCRRHFQMLYNRQENRLGLALVLDTHLAEQLGRLEKASAKTQRKDNAETRKAIADLLRNIETSCAVCDKITYTMTRYLEIIFHLWKKEADFRNLFNSKKGFCIKHFRQLFEISAEFLKASEAGNFNEILIKMQLENLDRIRQETDWFTKKFDYRNNDAPWGNSKDAIPRAIQKLSGY